MKQEVRPYIELKSVDVSYGTKVGNVHALRDVNVSIADKEFVSIIGPSGCGKTTLLKTIGSLVDPTAGSIHIGGKPAVKARKKRDIGFVFQKPVLLPWRTIIDNLRVPDEIMGTVQDRKRTAQLEEILDLVGVADFKDNHPHELSGGMQQRVAIARALSFNPSLLLMDEPFGALDEFTREKMNSELLRIWQRVKHTIVFVTHSIPEAVYLSDRIIVLSKRPGRVVDVIDVPFPRPRDFNVRYTKEFVQLTQRAHRLLIDDEK